MFYKNTLKTPKKSKKTFTFDVFDSKIARHQENSKPTEAAITYNFLLDKGVLTAGYGIKDLQMPTSKTELDTESQIPVVGKVSRMWSFEWFDSGNDNLNYYLFYFNDQQKLQYENLFNRRPLRLSVTTNYTSTPVGASHRINGIDYMIFSTKDGQVYVFGNGYNKYLENAPKLIDICIHDERVLALTAAERHELVYSDDTNILQWQDDTAKHIDFCDERGNLNKLISFNDYLYIFRDHGITRISNFSMEGDYNARHIYFSTSFIHPGSIAYDGDNVYFMTDDGFYRFDGNNVHKIDFVTQGMSFENCTAACFEGKYFLACRKDYFGVIGCEAGEHTNNVVFVYDTNAEVSTFVRGIDVRQILPLFNPHKSKLVFCFNGESEGRIAELTTGGKIFNQSQERVWQSAQTDFSLGQSDKKLESFLIKTSSKAKVTFAGDRGSKAFELEGSNKVQRVKCGLAFKRLSVRIESQSDDIKISNFQIEVSAQ